MTIKKIAIDEKQYGMIDFQCKSREKGKVTLF